MAARLRDAWPWSGSGHGPLPALLVMLTVVTGLVDAVSYLALGHVFVANMTGNVVFLGFALAGAPGLSAPASLVALGAFLVGAAAGGRIGARLASHRGHHLRTATALALPAVLAASLVAGLAGTPFSGGPRYALIVLLALAMGAQNATARRLAVPDLTTTVLTQTLTGVAADSRVAGGGGGRPGRRVIAVLAMGLGALTGALLVLHAEAFVSLGLAAALMATVALVAHRLSAGEPAWVAGDRAIPARSP